MTKTGRQRAVVVIEGCPQVGCEEVREPVRSTNEALWVLAKHHESHATSEAVIDFEEEYTDFSTGEQDWWPAGEDDEIGISLRGYTRKIDDLNEYYATKLKAALGRPHQ